jgi:kumamolisin
MPGHRYRWRRRILTIAITVLASYLAAGWASSAAAATPSIKPESQRVVMLALKRPENAVARFVESVSDPASPTYGEYLTLGQLRKRFGAAEKARHKVLRFLRAQDGVRSAQLGTTGSVVLETMTAPASRRIFCARGMKPPVKGLCRPKTLKGPVTHLVAGGTFKAKAKKEPGAEPSAGASALTGTPSGCEAALKAQNFTPNQIASAYESDQLAGRGLRGEGIRVATLSSALVETGELNQWARCFGVPKPNFQQSLMPSASLETSDAAEETYLDAEALLAVAPRIQRITAITVPLVESFRSAFPLFMLGALDPSRQGGKLPDLLSVSDGVCESQIPKAERGVDQRLLRDAAALGITVLAAAGDLGLHGCQEKATGTNWPASSPYVTSVGGTELTLDAGNRIADQVVWSTFATEPGGQGVGGGGGQSILWPRPSWQQAPGVATFGPPPFPGMRLTPDIASMASFTPGLSTLGGGEGWGPGGGTSAATPLTAGILALALQQERASGRPSFGALNPFLYAVANGPAYGSAFRDVVKGTSSPRPDTATGQTPIGGEAQPGYDLATGLGSLRAPGFAAAVAALRGG